MEDRRVRRTKREIRNALLRIMKKKKISDITVTELAREADIDRRTFYLHYSNIFDIVDEIEAEAVARMEDALSNEKYDSMEFFDCLTEIMMENYEYYEVIILDRSYYKLEHDCKDILKKGMTAYFRDSSKLDDLTFNYYLEYTSGGIMDMYTHWIREGKPCSQEQLTTLVRNAVGESWQKITEGKNNPVVKGGRF